MLSEKVRLRHAIVRRNALIDQLEAGLLTKRAFHQENYLLIESLQMKPYRCVETLQQGIYNYQYFNTMAKHETERLQHAHGRQRTRIMESVKNYYAQKDDTVRSLLMLQDKQCIRAYYVVTDSCLLRDRLIEIVFTDQEKVILHTLNRDILVLLDSWGVFSHETEISLIHSYINTGFKTHR